MRIQMAQFEWSDGQDGSDESSEDEDSDGSV